MIDGALSRWEVERDRFGVMFSGPLEVGECVEVVPVAEYNRDVVRLAQASADRLAALWDAVRAMREAERLLTPGMRAGTAEAKAILLRAIDGLAQAGES